MKLEKLLLTQPNGDNIVARILFVFLESDDGVARF